MFIVLQTLLGGSMDPSFVDRAAEGLHCLTMFIVPQMSLGGSVVPSCFHHPDLRQKGHVFIVQSHSVLN